MKTCVKCKQALPIDDFPAAKGYRDGHHSYCKPCFTAYKREWDRRNRDKTKLHREKFSAKVESKVKHSLAASQYRERYPEKIKARHLLEYAVKSGRMARLPCQFCGEGRSEAHHEDYSQPLAVVWVCGTCHRERYHG